MAEADVVVIGSGATGSLLAARLGSAGRKVVMLEAGPPRELSELYSSTVWSRRLKWRGAPVRVEGANPVAHPFEAGFGRGGSALHHYACWFRLHREDFKTATLYGRGLDWPIDYDDLRPYYDALQTEIGISGDAVQEVWRPPGGAISDAAAADISSGRDHCRGVQTSGRSRRAAPDGHQLHSVSRTPGLHSGRLV